jgi:hypothetical protein
VDKDAIWEAHAVAESPDDFEEPSLIPPDDDEHRVMLCRSCRLSRVFGRRKTRHSVHFMLALGTLGLWLPFWGFLIVLQRFKPWTCSACGVHQRDD